MLTVSGLPWVLALFKFAAAVFLALYIPGSLFLSSRTTKSRLVYLTLALVIGLVLWGWQEYLFGFLSLRDLSYLYLLSCLAVWVFKLIKKPPLSFLKKFKLKKAMKQADWLLFALVAVGVLIQVFPLWYNGLPFQGKGLLFTGGNVEDNLWHASLTHEIVKRFPPNGPGVPGVLLQNYHYWSNLIVASFVRVFGLPLFPSQFHFFLLLIAFLLGATAVSLCRTLRLSQLTTRLFVFFLYFGGDLIYLILFFLRRGPNLFGMASLEDGTKFLYNPPRAFSFVIALAGLALFVLWRKKKIGSLGVLSMLLLATTAGFKIYTALFFVGGLGLLGLIALLKRNWRDVFIYLLFPFFAALIYIPANAQAGGLIWAPFLIVNNFIVQPLLGLERWEMARMIFYQDRKYDKVLIFEIGFTILFFIALFGTKLLSFFQSPFYLFKKLGKELSLLLLVGIFSSLFVGLFFLQETGGGNTFNFIVSAFLFTSILVALSLAYWQEKLPKAPFSLFLIIVVLATIPRVVFETSTNAKNFLSPEGFLIKNEELDFYKLIGEDTSSFTVAVDPDHFWGRTSPYASLFLNQPLYLSGNGLLKHFRLDVEKEEGIQNSIFKETDEKVLIQNLLKHRVKYIVLYDNHSLPITSANLYTSASLQNDSGTLLKVDQERLKERCISILKQPCVLPPE